MNRRLFSIGLLLFTLLAATPLQSRAQVTFSVSYSPFGNYSRYSGYSSYAGYGFYGSPYMGGYSPYIGSYWRPRPSYNPANYETITPPNIKLIEQITAEGEAKKEAYYQNEVTKYQLVKENVVKENEVEIQETIQPFHIETFHPESDN